MYGVELTPVSIPTTSTTPYVPSQWVHCGHCGSHHSVQCPRIKAIEYYPDGTVKRVEYHG
jgi:hypothetical protein